MTIKDKIYGEAIITEPVLLELLKSPHISRLRNISQFGIPNKYYYLKNFSRYEHSIGVMILLRKLGAALEEQIAGLLHDVSVLAFSHVTDWVFGEGRKGKEDYHDSIHNSFVNNTKIPIILKKYGFALNQILDEKNFSLLEKDMPDLCADRVDYALREFKGWPNPLIIQKYVNNMANYNGEIIFSNSKTAFLFASNFLKLQTEHWGGYEAMMRYHLFSQALEIAVGEKFLCLEDFYKDEKFILNKLENSDNKIIQGLLKTLKNKKFKVVKNKSGKKIIKKFRYVDPKILQNGKLIRLSRINSKFRQVLNKHREINKKGLVVNFR